MIDFDFFKKKLASLKFPRNSLKIFCIGRNKTGTTSVKQALSDLGFKIGIQYKGELLIKEYSKRNFNPILNYCLTAQAFKDVPFSYPYTYIVLDQYFPKALFILTIRDDSEQWYRSLIRSQSQLFGKGEIPSKEDLLNAHYLYKGWPWDAHRILYNVPEDDIYNEEILKNHYKTYNDSVRDYFQFKNNLLVINVAHKNAYHQFCYFLEVKPLYEQFPWKNKRS